jgi:hypothetical protein
MAPDRADRAGQESGDLSRREFLGQVALAGAGVVGLTMLSTGGAEAAPEVQNIATKYTMIANWYSLELNIASQAGNTITGSFTDGTAVSGTVTGERGVPITIVFNRTLADGLIQTYTGAVSVTGDTDTMFFMAGVFFHNGAGPYPWSATGTIPG